MNPNQTADAKAPPDMSAVPDAVRQRGANADELMRRLQAGQDPYAQQPPEAGQEPPKQGQDSQEPPKPTHPTPERVAPQDAPQPRQEATPEPKPQPQAQDWEHKYNSLRGEFDKRTKQRDDALAEAASLRNVIATMEATGFQAPSAEGSAEPVTLADLSDEEKQEWGPEFVKAVNTLAARQTQELRQKLTDLERRVGGVAQVTAMSAQEKMVEGLTEQVPSWRELNDDPEFVAWLKNPDEASGQTRHELLLAAFKRNETARVAYFFRTFLRDERGETVTPAARTAEPTSQGRADAPKANGLEKFAAPGKGRSSAPPAEGAAKPPISTAEITQFYDDCRTGKYAGREEQRLAREQEIFAAQSEGRIVQAR